MPSQASSIVLPAFPVVLDLALAGPLVVALPVGLCTPPEELPPGVAVLVARALLFDFPPVGEAPRLPPNAE